MPKGEIPDLSLLESEKEFYIGNPQLQAWKKIGFYLGSQFESRFYFTYYFII